MPEKVYIRQWRTFRATKLQALTAATGLSVGALSLIETGRRGYSRRSLEAIAGALRCPAGCLLLHDPTESPEFWRIWDTIGDADRQRLVRSAMSWLEEHHTTLD